MPLPKINPEEEPKPEPKRKPKTPGRNRLAAGARSESDHLDSGSLVSRETVLQAVSALKDALAATKTIYGKTKGEFSTERDWPTIVRAAEMLLAYGEGRPIERRMEIRANAENFESHKARMMQSPEGIRFMLAVGAITQDEAKAAMVILKGDTAEHG